MSKLIIITTLSLLSLAVHAAADVTQINRYATVANKPLAAQVNPLLAVQHIHFPHDVQTVGEALTWWLRYSGFRLAPLEKQISSLQTVMQQPLPQIMRNLGPLTVHDGLEVLVGRDVFIVEANPLLREVNFKLKPIFVPKRSKL